MAGASINMKKLASLPKGRDSLLKILYHFVDEEVLNAADRAAIRQFFLAANAASGQGNFEQKSWWDMPTFTAAAQAARPVLASNFNNVTSACREVRRLTGALQQLNAFHGST